MLFRSMIEALATRSYRLGDWLAGDPNLYKYLGGAPVAAGVQVTEHTALNYSAVWAAVSRISATVASLPLILYQRRDGDQKRRYEEHPLYRVLHSEPNPEMSAMSFRETLQAHVLAWGNGYAEIVRNADGQVVELWPIEPNRVTIERRGGQILYVVATGDGPAQRFRASDILHVPGLGFDGRRGYSVVTMARESIGLSIAAERFGGQFFGNGSSFGGVLSNAGKLDRGRQQEIRQSIEEYHKGTSSAHKFLILSGEMKYERLGIPPDDAQFLETRKFQVTEIARWFTMPPHKLGDLERATFSNIEQSQIDWMTDTIRPWLVRWEQEINRKCIPRLERRLQYAEHVADAILRGDSASRSDFYTKMFQIGALSLNDILRLENQNTIGPDGDARFVPANLQTLDRALEEPEPAPPAPAPGGTPPQLEGGQAAAVATVNRGFIQTFEQRARAAARHGAAALRDWHADYVPRHRARWIEALERRGIPLAAEHVDASYASLAAAIRRALEGGEPLELGLAEAFEVRSALARQLEQGGEG